MDSLNSFFRSRYSTFLLVAIALGFGGAGPAQAVPDLTQEEVEVTRFTWNLGPTGMEGWIPHTVSRDVIFTNEARQILVVDVDERSPADGVIQEEDVILGVDGQEFDSDARRAFGDAITEAESEANNGELNLLLWRDGQTHEVTVPLQAMGSYSDTSPWDCEKSQRIIDAGLEHAADHLTDNIPGRFNALALLKSNRPEYKDLVREYFRDLGDPDLEVSLQGRGSGLGGGHVSWHWGHALIALAEYHLATGDDYVLPAMKTLADTIARGQSDFGTWGHTMAWTREYHPKEEYIGILGGYGALNGAAQMLHYGLVLAQEAGVENANIREAIEKSNEFFRFYVGKGSIPYGDHGPWHRHSNNGKNALAALMFTIQGDDESTSYFARMTAASYDEREHGHTGPYFSLAWGPLGVYTIGQDAVAEFLKPQRWYYDLTRQWDGSFEFHSRGNYRGWDMTGVFLLTYMLSEEPRLDMTGRNRNEDLALSEQELQDTLDAGKGFTLHDDGQTYYDERSVDELLDDLTSWSPTQRGRAAAALGRRSSEINVVGQLIDMLESDDLYTQLGAAVASKELGSDASDAVRHLEAILRDADDMWLRVQATEALANIGEAAYPAVPTMLRVAREADDDDPRQMLQRYVAESLFGTVLTPGNRGVQDIDRQELLQTVEAILSNPDGDVRRFVGTVYNQLNYEELRPILPAILLAVKEPGRTGIMFSDRIRLKGLDLLTRNHVREAMPLSLELMEPDRWNYHYRFDRIPGFIERYEGAAEPLLPKLREFRDYDGRRQTDERVERVDELIESIERNYEEGNIPELRSIMEDLPADHEQARERKEYFERLMREYRIRPESN